MEIQRFGDGFCRRKDASEPWEMVSADQATAAEIAQVLTAEALRQRNVDSPPRVGSVIIRSARNLRIAGELGLSADQLADRLVKPDQNQGTGRRVPEKDFDAMAKEIGLSPKEMRDRFAGRYKG